MAPNQAPPRITSDVRGLEYEHVRHTENQARHHVERLIGPWLLRIDSFPDGYEVVQLAKREAGTAASASDDRPSDQQPPTGSRFIKDGNLRKVTAPAEPVNGAADQTQGQTRDSNNATTTDPATRPTHGLLGSTEDIASKLARAHAAVPLEDAMRQALIEILQTVDERADLAGLQARPEPDDHVSGRVYGLSEALPGIAGTWQYIPMVEGSAQEVALTNTLRKLGESGVLGVESTSEPKAEQVCQTAAGVASEGPYGRD